MFKIKLSFILLFVMTTFRVSSQSIGGVTTGAIAYCDSVNSGFISLINYSGVILYWESSANGITWTNIGNTNSTQSYNNLKKNRSYRAIVKDGSFPNDTSSVTTISVHVTGDLGVMSGGTTYCSASGNGTLHLTSNPANILYWQSTQNNGLEWNTITNTSSVLNYSNLTKTTHYRAIVQPVISCPVDTSVIGSIKIDPTTVAGSILGADSLCYGAEGDTLVLKDHIGMVSDWLQSTNQGSTWQSLAFTGTQLTYTTLTKSIWYKTIVKSGTCNSATTSIGVLAPYNGNPAEAGDDKTITQFESVTLNGSGNGLPSWSDVSSLNDATIFNPIATPYNTTVYFLTLTDNHKCTTKDSVKVNVIVPIPTAITPNGDNVNDYFIIDKIDLYPNNSFQVFNRWGKLVYSAAPYTNTWNGTNARGTELPDEIYYYVFDTGNGEKPTTNYILIQR